MANFLGRLQTFLFGAAIGRASSDAITPVLEPVKQQAWFENQNKVLDANTAAEALAQGIITPTEAEFDANRTGVSTNRLGVLWRIAQAVPGVGEARNLRRRYKDDGSGRVITLDQLHHVYAKAKLEPQYWDALDALLVNLLEPAEIAKAIHRGIMKADGLLIASPPTQPGKVESVPPSNLDPIQEAAGSGIDAERLRILVGNAGLPLGLHEMLGLMNRGEMTPEDVQRGIAESNLRNEYQDVALALARQLLTARDYVEAQIRGYIDRETRLAGTRLHGMTDADSDLLYLNTGRPLVAHQITTGLARGGKFNPLPGELKDPYDAAVHESNVHPSYYDLWKANRYTYTVPFWWRSLATAGDLQPDAALQLLLNLGNPPEFAQAMVDHFVTTGTAAKTNPYIGKADTQLWTATHKAYKGNAIDQAAARQRFDLIGIPAAAQTAVLKRWDSEKTL